METKIITIPCNHQMKEIIETVDKDTLFKDILATKRQQLYSSFCYNSKEYLGETVRHIVVCKNCGKNIPAYPDYRKSYPMRIMDIDTALSISAHENSFHDEVLSINLFDPVSKDEYFTCPNCGTKDTFSEFTKDIYVKWSKRNITVSHIIKEPYQLRELDYIYFSDVRPETPATEAITFNFSKGSTYIEIKDAKEKTVFLKDITDSMDPSMYTSELTEIISKNKSVKNFLKRLFEGNIGCEVPYEEYQMEFYTFKNLTAFQGFDNKDFYSGIPVNTKTNQLEKDYRSAIKKLKTKVCIYNELMTKNFSESSEICNFIYENPFFLFYLDEEEILYKTFKSDATILKSFLENKNSVFYLGFIHKHPNAIDFFEEYVKIKGASELVELIGITDREKFRSYILEFITLNKSCKQQEIKKLKDTPFSLLIDEYDDGTNYPVVRNSITSTTIEQKIKGYCFSALKFNHEYLLSQNSFNNTLFFPNHCNLDYPVIKVSFGSETVALFQIFNNEVRQIEFSEFDNFTNADYNFIKVFVKWCSINNINHEFVLPQKLLTKILNEI